MVLEQNVKLPMGFRIYALIVFTIYAFWGLAIAPKLSYLGLGQAAAVDALNKILFYGTAVSLVFVLFIAGILVVWDFVSPKFKQNYSVFLHQSRLDPVLMILFSMLIFGIFYLGLAFIAPGSNFAQTSFPIVEQSAIATPGTTGYDLGQLAFAIWPASIEETIFAIGIALALVIIINPIYRGLTKSNLNFVFNAGIMILAITVTWFIMHLFRYGAREDILLIGVIPFGILTGVLIVATKSILPAIVLHEVNNAVNGAFLIFGPTATFTWGFIILVIIAVLIGAQILLLRRLNKGIFIGGG